MGFRDLSVFNQALLAKQVWRVLQCPQSLLARVYKAKYFPHTSLLEATVGHNPSYTWRSLMWDRDLLLTGLRWRVGNGRDINIFSSPWSHLRFVPSLLLVRVKMIGELKSSSRMANGTEMLLV